MISWRRVLWDSDIRKKFHHYFDDQTVENIVETTILIQINHEADAVGYFTYQIAHTFAGCKVVEIRHLIGEFDINIMYPILKQLGDLEDATIRIVSDREGFNKILHSYNFEKISTIWQLNEDTRQ